MQSNTPESGEKSVDKELIDSFGIGIGGSLSLGLDNINGQLSYTNNLYEQYTTNLQQQENKKTIENAERKIWDITKWIEQFNELEVGQEVLEQSNALQIFDAQETNISTFLGQTP